MTQQSPTEPPSLTGKQRRALRGQAHPLRPIVHVGEAGVSEAVVSATDSALADHELIKVRLHGPADKKADARRLSEATSSALCGVVGHTVILFRPKPEDSEIVLPD